MSAIPSRAEKADELVVSPGASSTSWSNQGQLPLPN
ncbi:hypothetical protein X744_06285 [Mesorhizobium sp. LNJC372A00]|nr:hypothetical protein X765_14370 [Mesorhizobium sp. LSHC440B00]ESY56580.1 hypothetical protein X745_05910 [Mesorhizobium sp. LNJC374B00]ESY61316.1 hypothetical protein X744_06285 [Mesorhizobium sp. LNJC372A00]